MNDFLQSIRNSQKEKRHNKNRRYYDGNNDYNQSGYDRRNGNDKRNKSSRPNNNREAVNHETLSAIKDLLEEMTSTRKKALEVESRRAAAEERKAEALETMGEYFKALADVVPALLSRNQAEVSCRKRDEEVYPSVMDVTNTDNETFSVVNKPLVSPAADPPCRVNRDEIVNMIKAMRDKGVTYDYIARQLTEKNIPTFSGRGEWHAQTIHRLCRKK